MTPNIIYTRQDPYRHLLIPDENESIDNPPKVYHLDTSQEYRVSDTYKLEVQDTYVAFLTYER